MAAEDSHPKILLLHDNELNDIRGLLSEFSIPFVERNGDPTSVDARTEWGLIISSQKRIGSFEKAETTQQARRIAVIDNDSRTLRAMLKRLGVDFVVPRPVHTAALRLLILHCIYRGPERRNKVRVSVGAKIQVRSGLRWRDAVLADLSLHGARLVCEKSVRAGAKLKLHFPSETGNAKGFSLPARSLRTAPATDPGQGHIVAVAFQGLSPAQGQRLRKVFETYQDGPARLVGTAGQTQRTAAISEDSEQPAERRSSRRVEYDKHIVTVDDEATRVLLCRDISVGGMRVNPNETLVPGDGLLVAVHIRSRTEPLVVNARVARDDGENGLVLEFHDLSKESADYLTKMVNLLPMLGVKSESGEDGETGLIISEIVERRAS